MWNVREPHLEPETTIYKWLLSIAWWTKSLRGKWLEVFHQTSMRKTGSLEFQADKMCSTFLRWRLVKGPRAPMLEDWFWRFQMELWSEKILRWTNQDFMPQRILICHMLYLPLHFVDFYGKLVGKYSSPMGMLLWDVFHDQWFIRPKKPSETYRRQSL